jgi:nucleoside-diphosphate-sugar epimerase
VFGAGGTGAIGSYAVPALVRAGHEVTALARTPQNAALLRERRAAPVMASTFDRAALTEAFAGHQAVINPATAIPPTWKILRTKAWAANDRVRTEGSVAIVNAAIADGVSLVVQQSVSMLYRDGGRGLDRRGLANGPVPAGAGEPRRRSQRQPVLGRGRGERGAAFRLVLRIRRHAQRGVPGPGAAPRLPAVGAA